MEFSEIKTSFLEYLREVKKTSGKNFDDLDVSEINIFKYADEFKDFLKDKMDVSDFKLMSMSVADILNMEIADGKSILEILNDDKEDEKTDEEVEPDKADDTEVSDKEEEVNKSDEKEKSEDTEDIKEEDDKAKEDDENELIGEVLNELFEDEDFKGTVDGDKNGKIDEKELTDFLNYIKDTDGNKEDISLEDIFKTIEAIKDGTFDMDNPLETDDSDDTEEDKDDKIPDNTPDTTPSGGSSGPSGGVSGGTYTPTTPVTPTQQDQQQEQTPKSLENMSKSELEQEMTTAKTELSNKQTKLNSALDGTSDELKEYKEKTDKSYEAYQKAVEEADSELGEKLKTITDNISAKEQEISSKEKEIVNSEIEIAEAKQAYETAEANVQTLTSMLSELEKSDSADKSTLISQVQSKLNEAKSKSEELKNALNDKEQNKTKLEQELENLKTGENGLESLNKEKEELEQKVAENPELKKLMDDYNEAKNEYDTTKEKLVSDARSEVEKARSRVEEINTHIQTANTKELEKEFKPGLTVEDLFDPSIKLTKTVINKGGMPYLLIAPEGVGPNEELPVLVYLHGSGERGNDPSILANNSFCPGGIMNNWGLNNFRGYIICPQTSERNWKSDTNAAAIDRILTDFCSTHNVNKGKIALAGASLGGDGAVYLAGRMGTRDVNEVGKNGKWFTKVAAMSAFGSPISPSEVSIPLIGYLGTSDKDGAITYMSQTFNTENANGEMIRLIKATGAEHGQVPRVLFSSDKNDNDHCSDLLEWLFVDGYVLNVNAT